jgi:spore coat polysaccharide biosynthesis protein SpsF
MGSSRFPGKVLKKLWKDNDAIDLLIRRFNHYKTILAIPDTKENDCLEEKAEKHKGLRIYRGDESRPFNRIHSLYKDIKKISPEEKFCFVEITADCPLIPSLLVRGILSAFIENKYDYFSNTITRSFPDGFDVQVYNPELLHILDLYITDKHRQHVGWNIVNYSSLLSFHLNTILKIGNLPALYEYNYPNWNLTLDYTQDLEVIKAFYDFHDNEDNEFLSIDKVINFYKQRPDLLEKSNLPRNIPGE